MHFIKVKYHSNCLWIYSYQSQHGIGTITKFTGGDQCVWEEDERGWCGGWGGVDDGV